MITEKDFIDKMVEIAKDGYEYMDSEAYSDEEPLTESNDFWSELASIL